MAKEQLFQITGTITEVLRVPIGYATREAHMTEKERLNLLDWEHMTDKEKLDFLYAWCHKLEVTLDGRAKVIYRLDAELRKKKVEKARRGRRGR